MQLILIKRNWFNRFWLNYDRKQSNIESAEKILPSKDEWLIWLGRWILAYFQWKCKQAANIFGTLSTGPIEEKRPDFDLFDFISSFFSIADAVVCINNSKKKKKKEKKKRKRSPGMEIFQFVRNCWFIGWMDCFEKLRKMAPECRCSCFAEYSNWWICSQLERLIMHDRYFWRGGYKPHRWSLYATEKATCCNPHEAGWVVLLLLLKTREKTLANL